MFKKKIQHNDVEGRPTETTAWFNLTKAEALELNIRMDVQLISESKDKDATMDAFNRIMSAAYGIRTGDGSFLKETPQGGRYFSNFKTTEAYSELFMELFSNPDAASEFIKAILPPEISNPDGQQSQTEIPPHLANHPGMQGRRAKLEVDPVREVNAVLPTSTVIHRTPEFETEQELAEFEAWKARKEQARADLIAEARSEARSMSAENTPSERVSPPEVTQADYPREDLV